MNAGNRGALLEVRGLTKQFPGTLALDMEPGKLKAEFGRDLVFWGGAVDPQHTLSFGTPEQAREEARRNIGAFKRGGEFVFNNPHNVQSNVRPENVVALYEAAGEHGGY